MFYPTKPITYEEIIRILERSWDKMNVELGDAQVSLQICRFQLTISTLQSEHGAITITTPHRTITFHTWCGSPYHLIDNGVESNSQDWEKWFYEMITKITQFIYNKKPELIPAFYFLHYIFSIIR